MDPRKLIGLLLVITLIFLVWAFAATLPSATPGESIGYASLASTSVNFPLLNMVLFFGIAVVLVLLYCVFKRFKQKKQGK